MSEFIIASFLPWFITGLGIILALSFFLYIPKITVFVHDHQRISFVLVIVLIIGGLIRFMLVPNIHRIYYDEDRYLSYAVAFARFGEARNIEFATLNKVIIGKPDHVARVTVPVINGWLLKIFGYAEQSLFLGAKAFSTLQILLLFIAAYLLFHDALIALMTSMLLMLFPTAIYWSTSSVLDPYFVMFSLITVIMSILYARRPSRIHAVLLCASFIILLFVRLESILFLIIILSLIYAIRAYEKQPLITRTDLLVIVLLSAILLARGWLSFSVLGETWCCGESTPLETFQISYFIRHLIPNINDLFFRPEIPWIFTLMTLGVLVGKKDVRVHALSAWFLFYFILYSSYYAGRFYDYQFSGSYGRFFLMLMSPFFILSSVGIMSIVRWIVIQKAILRAIFLCIFLLIFTVSSYPTMKSYSTLITTSPYARVVENSSIAFHNYLENMILKKVPKNSIIIHSLTGYTLLRGYPSIYIGTIYGNKEVGQYIVKELKKGTPIYSVPEYLCDVSPQKCTYFAPYVVFNEMDPDASKSGTLQRYMKLELKKTK